MAVEIGQHLCDALFCGRDALRRVLESELKAKRRLHAVTVKHFAFDLGRLERFRTDQFNDERAAFLIPDGTQPTIDKAAETKEQRLSFRQQRFAEAELGPIRMLPIPTHAQ
jgi:hypothetical protein